MTRPLVLVEEEIAALRAEIVGLPGDAYVKGALFALDALQDRLRHLHVERDSRVLQDFSTLLDGLQFRTPEPERDSER